MNYARFKNITIISAILLSSAVLLSWSQDWFVFTGPISPVNDLVTVSGQIAVPALSGLSLLNYAIVAVISLVNRVLRKILSLLIFVSGSTIVAITISALSNPIGSSQQQLQSISGISDVSTLSENINSVDTTAWVYLAPIAGLLLMAVGIVAFFTSAKWAEASRKYDKTYSSSTISPKSSRSSKNIDQWDALSSGEDPTNN